MLDLDPVIDWTIWALRNVRGLHVRPFWSMNHGRGQGQGEPAKGQGEGPSATQSPLVAWTEWLIMVVMLLGWQTL
jgi:hypothetical protein